MIEVTQRNTNGIIQILGTYTEQEFVRQYSEQDIEHMFANNSIFKFKQQVSIDAGYRREGRPMNWYVQILTFSKVAYNEKGKLLTTDYLIGIIRDYVYDRKVQPHRWT